MKGRVTSAKLKDTVTVLVERKSVHPLYKKSFIRSKKYQVHDLIGVKMGDIVEISEIKPISKNKYFKVEKVLGRSIAEIAEEQMKEKAEEIIEEVMPEKSEDQIKSENQSISESESQEISKPDETPKKRKTKLKKESK